MRKLSYASFLKFQVNRIQQQILGIKNITFSGKLSAAINAGINFDFVNCIMKNRYLKHKQQIFKKIQYISKMCLHVCFKRGSSFS